MEVKNFSIILERQKVASAWKKTQICLSLHKMLRLHFLLVNTYFPIHRLPSFKKKNMFGDARQSVCLFIILI